MVLALVGVCGIGFLVGLFAFKVKQRWCPTCGAALRCPDCADPGRATRVTAGTS